MKPDIKAQWIEALRSGEYRQTQRVLRDTTGYCCLGVLCDVIEPNGWETQGWRHEPDAWLCESDLSRTVLATIGLAMEDETKLINMNDDEGKDFRQIADYIEQKL